MPMIDLLWSGKIRSLHGWQKESSAHINSPLYSLSQVSVTKSDIENLQAVVDDLENSEEKLQSERRQLEEQLRDRDQLARTLDQTQKQLQLTESQASQFIRAVVIWAHKGIVTGIQVESGARKETGRFRDVKRCVATGD